MRNYIANFIYVDSDDDEQTKFQKLWKIKEVDQNDIIVVSDSEVKVGVDEKDLEEVDMLYRDFLDTSRFPSPVPKSNIQDIVILDVVEQQVPPIDRSPQASTATVPQSSFEQGESSRPNQEFPEFSGIPPSILRPGPALDMQQRLQMFEERHRITRMRYAFLEDTERHFFLSKRRRVNIYSILGVEKDQEWF